MFGRLLGWYTIYTFLGALGPLTEFCQVQNSLYIQVLHSPILAALLQRASAKLCGVVHGMELRGTFAEGATYIRLGGHHIGYCDERFECSCYNKGAI